MFQRVARPRPVVSLLLVTALIGCGGGGGGGGGSSGGGAGFTATVDGAAWAAEPVGVTAFGGGVPGGLVISGSQTVGGAVRGLTVNLSSISGPGTYALGVGPGVYGGSASVGESMAGAGGNSNRWATALDGLGGQIVITQFNAARVVATFSYVAVADKKNPAGGTRTVTDGRIDLPITGKVTPVPDKIGAKLSAMLNGKPFNAWAVSGRLSDYLGGAGVALDAHSSENKLSLMLVGVTAPGTYPISDVAPLVTITAGLTGGDADHCCWGLNAGNDTGSIVITSLTATRVQGTFSGTIQPHPDKPAKAPLVTTDGSFDVGIN